MTGRPRVTVGGRLPAGGALEDDSSPADLVFIGGAVHTVDRRAPWAEAVAIRDGRLIAVGESRDVERWIGAGTEVIGLGGRLLLPGFQDAHVHPARGGLERRRCDLSFLGSCTAYLEAVHVYAAAHPDAAWILGAGWSLPVFPDGSPTRDLLDKVVPNRPVFLMNRDHHGAWVNSRALELAGIDAATSDPPDGRIERDRLGTPSGTLQEGAMSLVARLIPGPSDEDRRQGLLEAQRYLHSLGVTAWQDAAVGDFDITAQSLETYRRLAEHGELTGRVVGALWWDRKRGADQIADLVSQRERATVGRFSPRSVKIMQDGICEDFTAALLDPYLDGRGCPTDRRGLSFIDPEGLKTYVTLLDDAGFQFHCHAIGERAVREALDAIEVAISKNGFRDRRPHLAHVQIVHPDDIPRFAGLGVTANVQPLWASNEPQMTRMTVPYLGAERSSWQYPFASLLRSGAQLAFGSDWSVSSPNPLWAIHVAVNRLPAPEGLGGRFSGDAPAVFLPEQRLDLADAIRAYTMGSAYVNHLDHMTGSIEVGKRADVVVVDRNIFREPVDAVASAQVVLTMVDGEIVYAGAGGL